MSAYSPLHAQTEAVTPPLPTEENPMESEKLTLPELDGYGRPIIGNTWRTWAWNSWGAWHPWHVHKGLNIALDLSVFSTFGSGRTWSGAGFTQEVSALYATRLNERMTLAVGGYFSNMIWAHDSYRNAGLTATLGYQINDRWTTFLYAQKSLFSNVPLPFFAYDLGNMGDRIGVGVEYKVTPSFTIGASFDVNHRTFERPHPTDIKQNTIDGSQQMPNAHNRVLNPLRR